MIRKQKLVAEIKTKSPFGFSSDESWDELAEAAIHFGDIISVHTDPKWGGSFDLIEKVRAMTDKPILAKGIHSNDEEVREAIKRGANYVLVVDRIPVISLRSVCWFEPTKTEIVEELIPKSLKIQLFKSLLDSNASEHGARMTAMHKATDNETELRDQLKLTYNKARQAAITNEILEIVGGAEALNG